MILHQEAVFLGAPGVFQGEAQYFAQSGQQGRQGGGQFLIRGAKQGQNAAAFRPEPEAGDERDPGYASGLARGQAGAAAKSGGCHGTQFGAVAAQAFQQSLRRILSPGLAYSCQQFGFAGLRVQQAQ